MSELQALVLVLMCFVVSLLGTGLLRWHALKCGLLDMPNARSSHSMPTPRGGGAAIFLASQFGMTVLFATGQLDRDLFFALAGGGLAVSVVGYIDDRRHLSAGLRLLVHVAAAVWAVVWIGGIPPLQIADHVVTLGSTGFVLGVLAIVWTLNLFNFMDGIDGIAAAEAALVAVSGAVLAVIAGVSGSVSAACLVFGAACSGFLLWNWPPAKIFMGDVGSGYLGYVIAVLSLASGRESAVMPFGWLILGGVFFMDATVTVVRRTIRGERVYEAHRTHAYQWLARRWGSHQRVTLVIAAINLFWLFPCALLATMYPRHALGILLLALISLLILALKAGAGRSEGASQLSNQIGQP